MMAQDKTESWLTYAGQVAHWSADYSVDICHAAGAAFIDKFQLFLFGNTGFTGVCHDVVLHNCSCCSEIVQL